MHPSLRPDSARLGLPVHVRFSSRVRPATFLRLRSAPPQRNGTPALLFNTPAHRRIPNQQFRSSIPWQALLMLP